MRQCKKWRILNIASLFCLLPFILLAAYNQPSIHDDYMDANAIIKLGFAGYIKNYYMHWTGRYTELILKSFLNPLIYSDSELVSRVSTMGVFIIMFFSVYIACRTIIGKYDLLQISLMLSVTLLCGLTDIGSFFYWYGGYTSYTLGLVFSLYFFAFLYKVKTSPLFCYRLGCSLFLILASGSYEVITVALLWITITNIVYSAVYDQGLKDAVFLGVISAISAVFILFSPGNFARMSGISAADYDISFYRIIISLCKSVVFTAEAITSWLDSITLGLGVIIVIQLLCETKQIKKLRTNFNPLLVFLWVFVGISLCILPSVVSYQTVWLHTWQSVYFFFLVGWLVVCSSLFFYFDDKYNIQKKLLKKSIIRSTRLGFFGIVLVSNTSNVHIAYWDLLYVSNYEERIKKRVCKVKSSAKNSKISELYPLFLHSEKYMIPRTLYTVEYNEGDAHAFAEYYGADSVLMQRNHLQ